ncbi:ShET2 enterotoxin domain-containing protein [Yersinia pseudotuberculosis]|nr:ShET2 enterotoxin domain-containing protein [Yersinia pseudotuberculosis]
MEILTAKSPDGTMGFEQALLNDHADAINAFGELLQLVPENRRSELFINDKKTKYTLFDIVCSRESNETITAFKNIVSLISKNERYKLMESKVNILDAIINLFITQKNSSNLNGIFELISLAPEEHIINLLSNIDITQSLEYSLYHNDAKSINIITKMLNKLSEQGRENIPFLRKLDESIVNMYIQLGKKEAVSAYRELLALKPGTLKESK